MGGGRRKNKNNGMTQRYNFIVSKDDHRMLLKINCCHLRANYDLVNYLYNRNGRAFDNVIANLYIRTFCMWGERRLNAYLEVYPQFYLWNRERRMPRKYDGIEMEWDILTNFCLRLFNQRGSYHLECPKYRHNFCSNPGGVFVGGLFLMKEKNLYVGHQHFLKDKTMEIAAFFRIETFWQHKYRRNTTFSEVAANAIVVVEKEFFYCNKEYLAMYSDFFFETFFSESPQVFAELENIKRETFEKFLKMIYPCHMRVEYHEEEIAEEMLEVAEYLGCDYLKKRFEEYLLSLRPDFTLYKKAFLAFRYGLIKVQANTALSLFCKRAFEKFKKSQEYSLFSDPEKDRLIEEFQKIIKRYSIDAIEYSK